MGKIHRTTVTFLEMHADPKLRVAPPPTQLALLRARKMPLHFYRYLYDVVGRDYVWVNRKRFSDEDLAHVVHDNRVEIYVLNSGGVPAGFVELDFREAGTGELAYMGLVPEFVGQGLGEYLLAQAIEIAWLQPISRLKVQTCTMDHPRALGLYQRMGFSPYAQTEAKLEELD